MCIRDSPAGALWLKDPTERFFAQAACWHMPASSATEDADSKLCQFLLDSGWVINLEDVSYTHQDVYKRQATYDSITCELAG